MRAARRAVGTGSDSRWIRLMLFLVFIVRHMVKDHGVAPAAVVAMEPSLADEVEEYCRRMGLRG